MGTEVSGTVANSNEEAVPGKTGRPPPIILTSTTNLIQLQKQLKNVDKENIEFRSTRNGTNPSNANLTPITRLFTRSIPNPKNP
jgi:hypothetical protein